MPIIPEGKALCYFCRFAVGLISLLLVFGTALPILRSDAWWIRVFDFPRVQIAVLLGLSLTAYVALHFWGSLRVWEYALAAAVVSGLIWQLASIVPYTSLYPHQMSDSRSEEDSNRISLLIYNVLSDNQGVEALLDLIRDTDPDVILLSEPNQRWLNQLGGLEDAYPHTLFQPQENQYGMLLYSRLKLENPEIQFLIDPEIPSFRTGVRLRSGAVVTLFGVHPRPPGIKSTEKDNESDTGEDERKKDEEGDREDSDMRDAELLLVAREIKKLKNVPVIVAGDFNDVAWSRTTHLFQRIGGLLDPRVGRGLFNTFDATNWRVLRYPLDHVFASEHFFLVEMRRLPEIGSDHFPVLAVLDYNPASSAGNREPQSDADDEDKADEAIAEGKANH